MKNKEIVKSIVVLVVICLLTSAALAVVNHFTAPVSAANAEARAQQAQHLFCINSVFCAAQRDYADSLWHDRTSNANLCSYFCAIIA